MASGELRSFQEVAARLEKGTKEADRMICNSRGLWPFFKGGFVMGRGVLTGVVDLLVLIIFVIVVNVCFSSHYYYIRAVLLYYITCSSV